MRKILIVDDCVIDQKLVSGLLRNQSDFLLQYANDGHQALAAVEKSVPDLVITDMQMPNLDGLCLVKQLSQRWPLLPVVLITGQGSEDIAVEALRAGAASYSPKRYLERDLVQTVKQVLRRAHLAKQHKRLVERVVECSISYQLENDEELISPLIEHLQDNMPRWSEPEQLRIGMAVGEALVNAMHHGNLEVCSQLKEDKEEQYYELIKQRRVQTPFSNRKVFIHSQFSPQEICITINDQGPGFDTNCLPDPTSPENLTKLSGRGLLLIRSFMDEVSHNSCGNRITMIKRRTT